MEESRVTASRNLKFAISHVFEASMLIKDTWIHLEDASVGPDLMPYAFEMTKIANELFVISRSIVDPVRFTEERIQTRSPVTSISDTATVQILSEAPPNPNNSGQNQMMANREVQKSPEAHISNQEQNETRDNIEVKTLEDAQLHSRNQEQNQTKGDLKIQKLEDSQPEQKQIKNIEAKNLTDVNPHAGVQQDNPVKAVQRGHNLQSGQKVVDNPQEKQIKHNLGGQNLEDSQRVLVNSNQKQIKNKEAQNFTNADPHAGRQQENQLKAELGGQNLQSGQTVFAKPQQKQIEHSLGGQIGQQQKQIATNLGGRLDVGNLQQNQVNKNMWTQHLHIGQPSVFGNSLEKQIKLNWGGQTSQQQNQIITNVPGQNNQLGHPDFGNQQQMLAMLKLQLQNLDNRQSQIATQQKKPALCSAYNLVSKMQILKIVLYFDRSDVFSTLENNNRRRQTLKYIKLHEKDEEGPLEPSTDVDFGFWV
uniref:Uncharacterized protein n=1 Tax=Glossina austeni TaxID=7395 RepID=A0A1A9VCK1_GLOAU